MAIPTTDIFLRSPYWVSVTETDLDYVLCALRVWTGNMTDEPVNANIKLRSTSFDGSTHFDIAEFARDYVEVTFGGTDESNAVFISYELTKYLHGALDTPPAEAKVYLTGYDGYGTFQDEANFSSTSEVMMTDSTVDCYPNSSIAIPVRQNKLTGYLLQRRVGNHNNYTTFKTVTGLTVVENTANMVKYVANNFGGVYADRIVLQYTTGPDQNMQINYKDCTKYGLNQIFFVNKLGATQQLHFSGKFEASMTATEETYKRNLLVGATYDPTRHQTYTLNKNGKVSFTVNSGWVSEEANDTMIEMLMSEQVWMRVDVQKLGLGWLPKQATHYIVAVTVKSEEKIIKSRLNDKMINYTFKMEAASDWINNVR